MLLNTEVVLNLQKWKLAYSLDFIHTCDARIPNLCIVLYLFIHSVSVPGRWYCIVLYYACCSARTECMPRLNMMVREFSYIRMALSFSISLEVSNLSFHIR